MRVHVFRFIHESDFVNIGNGFLLKDCPHWELYSTTLLELTDLLDDTSFFFFSRGLEALGQQSLW